MTCPAVPSSLFAVAGAGGNAHATSPLATSTTATRLLSCPWGFAIRIEEDAAVPSAPLDTTSEALQKLYATSPSASPRTVSHSLAWEPSGRTICVLRRPLRP